MGLRINHNAAVQNAYRNVKNSQSKVHKDLELLSSGRKINAAKDGAANLSLSERLRGQISGLNQAASNLETGISFVQVAEANIHEISRLLLDARQLAVHAANEGVNSEIAIEQDQNELKNVLKNIDKISESAQFGNKRILNGSNSSQTFYTSNKELEVVSFGEKTRCPGTEGFEVRIITPPRKARIYNVELLDFWNDARVKLAEIGRDDATLNIKIGDKRHHMQIEKWIEDDDEKDWNLINRETSELYLFLKAFFETKFDWERLEYEAATGSGEQDSVTPGRIVDIQNINARSYDEFINNSNWYLYYEPESFYEDATIELNIPELDMAFKSEPTAIEGTINGEEAIGQGEILTGKSGSSNVDGLQVKFTGKIGEEWGVVPEEGEIVGKVFGKINPLRLQIGSGTGHIASFFIESTKTENLAMDIENKSGFGNLKTISLKTRQKASDSLLLIDEAIDQISKQRAELGSFQKTKLESSLSNLKTMTENISSSESTIRDADVAMTIARQAKNQLKNQASVNSLMTASMSSKNILDLLS